MNQLTHRFDLLTEPWIPCIARPVVDEGVSEDYLGVREVLLRAHDLVEIIGDNPLETVAVHRMLLAILHRVLGPDDADAWEHLWQRGRFDKQTIESYLDQWQERFDLFHPRWPFYQTAGLDRSRVGSTARLFFQADNNPTLFDHTVTARPPDLSPAKAARLVLAMQAFDPGGTKTGERGPATAQHAPLVQAAVVLAQGESLFKTLMLNLYHYSPERDEQPWRFSRVDDLPAWERNAPTEGRERTPDGYCDWLTWQSRRFLLVPTGQAPVVVPEAVFMPGWRLPSLFERRTCETMVAFRRRHKAKPDEAPWWPLGFREERGIWRDFEALSTSLETDVARPRTAGWIAELVSRGKPPEHQVLPFDVYGLAVDRAKCLFWRHERVAIPTSVLVDPDMSGALRESIQFAETVARLLSASSVALPGMERSVLTPLAVMAEHLCPSKDKAQRKAVRVQLSTEAFFWSLVEPAFWRLVGALPLDASHDEFGNRVVGSRVIPAWRSEVREALEAAFSAAVQRAGTTSRALEAVARSEATYRGLVGRLFPGSPRGQTRGEGSDDVE